MRKRKTAFDDGYQGHLVEGAELVGKAGIPALLDQGNAEIPRKLISFEKAPYAKDKRGYVHFYIHDIKYGEIFSATEKYLPLLQQFDGVITPDPTIVVGKSDCLHATSTYFNRAVGYYLQKHGIRVIPNIRWGEEATYEYAFLGVPKNSIVCISTHGVIAKDKESHDLLRNVFKKGLRVMLDTLTPKIILVYGRMPEDIFGAYLGKYRFVRYPSEFELTHRKEDN